MQNDLFGYCCSKVAITSFTYFLRCTLQSETKGSIACNEELSVSQRALYVSSPNFGENYGFPTDSP